MKRVLQASAIFLVFSIFTIQAGAQTPPSPAPSPTPSDDAAKPAVSPAQNGYVRPTSKTRFKRYVNGMFGPMTLGKSVAFSGWSTWRNSPEEWGDRWPGFGRRVASSLGANVIKQTTMYGLAEAFKLDNGYYRSQKRDFGSKVRNALISPVTARNREGKRVFGFPRIAGTYAGAIVAREVWYPARFDWKDGLKSGTLSLGFSAGYNLIKEFIWKK